MKGLGCRVNVGARLSCGEVCCAWVRDDAVTWGRTTPFGDSKCAEARRLTRLHAGGETGPVLGQKGPKMGQKVRGFGPEARKVPRIEFFLLFTRL